MERRRIVGGIQINLRGFVTRILSPLNSQYINSYLILSINLTLLYTRESMIEIQKNSII